MSTSSRIRRLPSALAAAALLSLLPALPAAAQSIAVVVNGQPILSTEIKARASLLALSGGKANEAAAREELIDEKLKLAEAKRYGMQPDSAQVEQAFASIAQRTKLTVDQFTKAIGQRGVSAQTLKSRIAAEMVWAQLVRRKFAAQIASREREVIAGMQNKPTNKATQYTLRQVVFVIPKGASAAQEQQRRAEAVGARGRFPGCEQAIQFASALRDVAVKEPVTRSSGALGKEFSETLDKVKIGGLTEPQRGEQGFEMIAVCERKEINDDSVLRQAAQQEFGAKHAEEQAKKYVAQLRSRAIIQIR